MEEIWGCGEADSTGESLWDILVMAEYSSENSELSDRLVRSSKSRRDLLIGGKIWRRPRYRVEDLQVIGKLGVN